ncbi:GLPGLI family protein [Lutibacter oricola]|uniref:GLPGLI family protein n=1 Tax=Lutibacter oricola TaxID=762486 RepID=A0A1H3B5T8_9FLAO|nr:GLPGLI family protein [Lutibacter oricola]SDX37283.1 GLPGLI family protein [Lutibacter oricola]
MKKLIYSLLFCLLTISSYSQNGVATYSFLLAKNGMNEKIDSLTKKDTGSNKTEALSLLKGIFQSNTESFEFQLKFNQDNSLFSFQEKMDIDNENGIKTTLLKSMSSSNKKYYYNRKSKEIYNQTVLLGETYLIKSSSDSLQWNLTNESQVIKGYTCFKAVTYKKRYNLSGTISKDKVVAWYAPSIPLTYGPYNFVGLPGLVIEVYEKNKMITLTKLEFIEKEQTITPLTKGIKTTEANLLKDARKYMRQN